MGGKCTLSNSVLALFQCLRHTGQGRLIPSPSSVIGWLFCRTELPGLGSATDRSMSPVRGFGFVQAVANDFKAPCSLEVEAVALSNF